MARHKVTIELDDFGYTELEAIAQRQGVTIEELVAHAAMYYLAGAGNGSMAAQVPQGADGAPERVEQP